MKFIAYIDAVTFIKVNFSAPMVVGGSPPVRVGRRQALKG